ncbi:hypothetical protein BO94DRAFT_575139 [Aspergillus sclerotioniger CBS 115572]|uniref:Rhodopsin domain-containing protein n=1 Tax=Aspergillus sclerotioniger CBS 115572 TaxID=1450535 RepID=A0A317WV14_9EURO|nr:hypothetical protein BO94DRAFT_575139 [Aspergillus sclerotioniger CBS 115572]PWY88110.1 hypothetical protein BO94DRAFT_575139 [Aspergillus sclerotioniger CBS 115572]
MASASYNAGPYILAINWIVAGAAVLIFLLRLIAKRRVRNVSWDDAAMLFALMLGLASSVLITLAILHGYGKHVKDIEPSDRSVAMKLYTIFQCVSILSTGTGRVAFVLYLLPIFQQQYLTRHLLWFILALQTVTNYVSPVTILAQCKDIHVLWDPTVMTQCWDPKISIAYSYVQCSINTATDLYLATFPVYTFLRLNIKRRTKGILIILMSLGLVAMVASIMRALYLPSLSKIGDRTAATNRLTIWALLECYLVIITASIPCIRSLVVDSVRHIISSGRSTSVRDPDSTPKHSRQNTWGDSTSWNYPVGDDVEGRRHILSEVELGRLGRARADSGRVEYGHVGYGRVDYCRVDRNRFNSTRISKLMEVSVAAEAIPKWI